MVRLWGAGRRYGILVVFGLAAVVFGIGLFAASDPVWAGGGLGFVEYLPFISKASSQAQLATCQATRESYGVLNVIPPPTDRPAEHSTWPSGDMNQRELTWAW